MAEVTYFVALPFVAADDGIAPGEPTECFNPQGETHGPSRRSGKPQRARSEPPKLESTLRRVNVEKSPIDSDCL
jgi:hypothetical protein